MAKTVTLEKRPASLLKRFIAYLIDLIIIDLIIVMPFNNTLKGLSEYGDNFIGYVDFIMSNPDKMLQLIMISMVIILFSIAYWTILEFKLRQSIGKMFLNIRVVSNNKKFTVWQCLIRNISKPINLLLLIDVIYLLVNRKNNQRLFEKLSDTRVVEEVMKI